MEHNSSLVCIADTSRKVSNVTYTGVQRENMELESITAADYEYKGIGNMVRNENLGNVENFPFFQFAVCQIAWVLLEYTRTTMFHWMFLEVT